MTFLNKLKREDLQNLAIEFAIQITPDLRKLQLINLILKNERYEESLARSLADKIAQTRLDRKRKEKESEREERKKEWEREKKEWEIEFEMKKLVLRITWHEIENGLINNSPMKKLQRYIQNSIPKFGPAQNDITLPVLKRLNRLLDKSRVSVMQPNVTILEVDTECELEDLVHKLLLAEESEFEHPAQRLLIDSIDKNTGTKENSLDYVEDEIIGIEEKNTGSEEQYPDCLGKEMLAVLEKRADSKKGKGSECLKKEVPIVSKRREKREGDKVSPEMTSPNQQNGGKGVVNVPSVAPTQRVQRVGRERSTKFSPRQQPSSGFGDKRRKGKLRRERSGRNCHPSVSLWGRKWGKSRTDNRPTNGDRIVVNDCAGKDRGFVDPLLRKQKLSVGISPCLDNRVLKKWKGKPITKRFRDFERVTGKEARRFLNGIMPNLDGYGFGIDDKLVSKSNTENTAVHKLHRKFYPDSFD